MPADRMQMITGAAEDGLQRLGLDASASPQVVIEALDAWVDRFQHGELSDDEPMDAEDVPYTFGPLWGQQPVRQFGWEWATVTFHEHGNSQAPGVLSPDRSLAVYPIHFLIGCMKDQGVDVTIALAFNMLSAGKADGQKPAGYYNLMDGVRRIVPRR